MTPRLAEVPAAGPVSEPDPSFDRAAVATIRALVMDMVEEAGTGHPGTAMSLAPVLHLLFSEVLKLDPADPGWPDRDRFVLSSGHASAGLYAALHLSGYELSLDDLRGFRKPESRCPGHPERLRTPGVEVTTGALGQGFANAVGLALAESVLRAQFGPELCDHRTFVIAGNGDLQEGLSHEAGALAGHWGLERLVCVYNDNRLTLEGSIELSSSEEVADRFAAYGWRVVELGEICEDLGRLRTGLLDACTPSGAPTFVTVRTRVGTPSPTLTDDRRSHGRPLGAEEVRRTKTVMGMPADESFSVPAQVLAGYRARIARRVEQRTAWHERCAGHPNGATFLRRMRGPELTAQVRIPEADAVAELSPRTASQRVIEALAQQESGLIVGSADLAEGNGTALPAATAYSAAAPHGQQVFYGAREHGMAAIMTGAAAHGGLLPVGGTYLVFSDYLRPALRMAALNGVHMILALTHDGLDCAEDGPTHHAPEHLAALRAMPGIRVLRPADAVETAQAWSLAVAADRPVALVLSREPVPQLTAVPRDGVRRGAYVLSSDSDPDVILIGTGIEVHTCLEAARLLRGSGLGVRVISAPAWDLFEAQPQSYRERVVPDGVPVFGVEAGVAPGWGAIPRIAPVDRLGPSGSAAWLREQYGLTAGHIARAVGERVGGVE